VTRRKFEVPSLKSEDSTLGPPASNLTLDTPVQIGFVSSRPFAAPVRHNSFSHKVLVSPDALTKLGLFRTNAHHGDTEGTENGAAKKRDNAQKGTGRLGAQPPRGCLLGLPSRRRPGYTLFFAFFRLMWS
jgi:hypothetical protein